MPYRKVKRCWLGYQNGLNFIVEQLKFLSREKALGGQ